MKNIISVILNNVLTAMYQSFWFSVIFSFFFMYFYMAVNGTSKSMNSGFNVAIKMWWSEFILSRLFRRCFYLSIYTMMILFRTLLNRTIWLNPLSNVIGDWWIYTLNQETNEWILTTECIENTMLFVPFAILLSAFIRERDGSIPIISTIKIGFYFSLLIEFLQLFLKLGTFQLSDIAYNTLGAVVGTFLFISILKAVKIFRFLTKKCYVDTRCQVPENGNKKKKSKSKVC